jgi:hypothetical protein
MSVKGYVDVVYESVDSGGESHAPHVGAGSTRGCNSSHRSPVGVNHVLGKIRVSIISESPAFLHPGKIASDGSAGMDTNITTVDRVG